MEVDGSDEFSGVKKLGQFSGFKKTVHFSGMRQAFFCKITLISIFGLTGKNQNAGSFFLGGGGGVEILFYCMEYIF